MINAKIVASQFSSICNLCVGNVHIKDLSYVGVWWNSSNKLLHFAERKCCNQNFRSFRYKRENRLPCLNIVLLYLYMVSSPCVSNPLLIAIALLRLNILQSVTVVVNNFFLIFSREQSFINLYPFASASVLRGRYRFFYVCSNVTIVYPHFSRISNPSW